MPKIIRDSKTTAQAELKQSAKLKPLLRKFVVSEMQKGAQAAAKKKKEETDFLLSSEEVIRQASKLAAKAFFEIKVWQKVPPFFSMDWLHQGAATAALEREMQVDVAGFATYLVREYNNYFKYKALERGYPHPLREENIMFFWQKMQADLALLLGAEQQMVAKGNKGVMTDSKPSVDTTVEQAVKSMGKAVQTDSGIILPADYKKKV